MDMAGETGAGDLAPIVDKAGSGSWVGSHAQFRRVAAAGTCLQAGTTVSASKSTASCRTWSATGRGVLVHRRGNAPLQDRRARLGERLPVVSSTRRSESAARAVDLNERRQLLSVQMFAPGLDYVTMPQAFSCRPAVPARPAHRHAAAIPARKSQRPPSQSPGHRHAATPERGHLRRRCQGQSSRPDEAVWR